MSELKISELALLFSIVFSFYLASLEIINLILSRVDLKDYKMML
jgi:hypothetical protein